MLPRKVRKLEHASSTREAPSQGTLGSRTVAYPTQSYNGIDQLPNEVLRHIFGCAVSYSDWLSLGRLGLVCQRWRLMQRDLIASLLKHNKIDLKSDLKKSFNEALPYLKSFGEALKSANLSKYQSNVNDENVQALISKCPRLQSLEPWVLQ